MRNYFSITISDVHGSRTYSFKQFIKKFIKYLILFILLVLFVGAATIWWLNKQALELENKRQQEEMQHQSSLLEHQKAYILLDNNKRDLQADLDNKLRELEFLDSTLQGLEELLGQTPREALPLEERVKMVQLSTIEKSLAFDLIPSGFPVTDVKSKSSGFGYRIHPIDKVRRFHHGLDFRGKIGTPVFSTADGVVEYAGYNKGSGFGNMVIVTHANGFRTLYAHLNKVLVTRGQVVTKGMKVGELGNTGRSTGPHLHYEIIFLGRKLDPKPFVYWDFDNYEAIFTEVKGIPWASLMQRIRNHVQKVEEQLLPLAVKSAENSPS